MYSLGVVVVVATVVFGVVVVVEVVVVSFTVVDVVLELDVVSTATGFVVSTVVVVVAFFSDDVLVVSIKDVVVDEDDVDVVVDEVVPVTVVIDTVSSYPIPSLKISMISLTSSIASDNVSCTVAVIPETFVSGSSRYNANTGNAIHVNPIAAPVRIPIALMNNGFFLT